MWVAFANAKATHIFFSKNITEYAIFNDQSFNDTLTNNIVSFEQLGPDRPIGEEEVDCFDFHWSENMCTVRRSLFALLLGVIGRLCSVIVSLSGNLL